MEYEEIFPSACYAGRREGIGTNVYFKWLKDFIEAGKARLKGDTVLDATKAEVEALKRVWFGVLIVVMIEWGR